MDHPTVGPLAASGAFGLIVLCDTLAKKGVLDQADFLAISHHALESFDAWQEAAGNEPAMREQVERHRALLERTWESARDRNEPRQS